MNNVISCSSIDYIHREVITRKLGLGRRNHLFAGSHAGAQKAAMFYSFFGTCKFNDVDPFTWFKTVLEIIPDYPANKLVDLLPKNLDLP